MTAPVDSQLNPCGCCDDESPRTPLSTANRPGLPALRYRVGTHAAFKASMLLKIAQQDALSGLTTRDDDDPSIALCDAAATVLDVLTFYAERNINEGYLLTATERRSIQWLAQAVGYRLRPGIAAQTYLAFDIEGATGTPGVATIDIGTKTQTIPGPGETPQTFETIEKIEARAVWNRLTPQIKRIKVPDIGATSAAFAGAASNLKPGDGLLFIKQSATGATCDFRQIKTVVVDRGNDLLTVTWDTALTFAASVTPPADQSYTAGNTYAFAMRTRASLFGHNAPDVRTMPDNIITAFEITDDPPVQWPNLSLTLVGQPKIVKATGQRETLPNDPAVIFLDAIYPQITKSSWIVLTAPGGIVFVFLVNDVADDSRTDFTLSARTTRIQLDKDRDASLDNLLRQISVFAQSDPLQFAQVPNTDYIENDTVTLNSEVDGLLPGRTLIVSGLDATTLQPDSQIVTLKTVAQTTDGLTQLTFVEALRHAYDRPSTVLYGNVALATHGESKVETLGSGDASQPFQHFTLKGVPLTYLQSTQPAGQSTLTITVNDVKWDEVRALYGHGPRERIFITQDNADSTTTVEDGDGVTGARWPSGDSNIKAAYRVGSGRAGMAKAEQIRLLLTRPLGVKAVINPLPAEGGVDPEAQDDARQNAALTVLTFDRVVSLRDFEDFSRTFPGIGKAQAIWLWNGKRQIIHVTVAGIDGQAIGPGYSTFDNLKAAIANAESVPFSFRLDPYQQQLFSVSARLLIDPSYDQDKVTTAVNAALLGAFGFAKRSFGQSVAASEVIAVIQGVPGVVAVGLVDPGLDTTITSQPAHVDPAQGIVGADLVLIDPNAITLTPVRRLQP